MNRTGISLQDAALPGSPAVVVHGTSHANAVLRLGVPVVLLSAVGAARLGGPAWWRAMVNAARKDHPASPCIDILDCVDAAGLAMAALRLGQRHLLLWPESPAFAAVSDAASCLGARVFAVRPPALDLSERGALRHLEEYLRPKNPDPALDRDSAGLLR
eukprot:gene10911-10993_t